ncbi:MAG: type II toxin-antitoxin system RelE/ParE family toxin [Salinarimonas sp.]|nr:type II toxin-antitoxin system RelE/ParE family toxin [Salinarimonas sp.]
MPSITRTRRAEEDLIGIWLSIAADNPDAADRLLDAFEARWQHLLSHPWSGIARDDIASGIRHLVIGQYLTFYRVLDDGIEIVRVLHARRNVAREISEQ